jgi:hypothetical protein
MLPAQNPRKSTLDDLNKTLDAIDALQTSRWANLPPSFQDQPTPEKIVAVNQSLNARPKKAHRPKPVARFENDFSTAKRKAGKLQTGQIAQISKRASSFEGRTFGKNSFRSNSYLLGEIACKLMPRSFRNPSVIVP